LQKQRKLKKNSRLKIPKINHEQYLLGLGFKNIVGVDEVGRGSWAGPLVVAAVQLPIKNRLYHLRDSKLLTAQKRLKLARKIRKTSSFAIGQVEVFEINKLGLGQALQLAFRRAISNLKIKPDFILVDGFRLPDLKISQKAIIAGDLKCASIAAASIVAKSYRDSLMEKLSRKYVGYYLEKNKGYGTHQHQKALAVNGPCEIHRNYRPIRKLKFEYRNSKS